MPNAFVAVVITAHVAVWPLAAGSMQLLMPTTLNLASNRAMREGNEETLGAVLSLVETLHCTSHS